MQKARPASPYCRQEYLQMTTLKGFEPQWPYARQAGSERRFLATASECEIAFLFAAMPIFEINFFNSMQAENNQELNLNIVADLFNSLNQ